MMRVAIAHNSLSEESHPDDRDVLVQADVVREALERLGHNVTRMTCDLDLEAARQQLLSLKPDLVFNLVESLAGTGRLISLFPSLLDALALPYSGCATEAVFMTSNKLVAKSCLKAAGLPTPPWIVFEGQSLAAEDVDQAGCWVVKSVWEHASIGLDEDAILVHPDAPAMAAALHHRAPLLGGSCFGEVFIDGREFNLSLLDGPGGVQVLPPAEIMFEGYQEGKTRIVDYRAKWDEHSYEYHHTPRNFDFPFQDQALLGHLERLALACWKLFNLGGYARVDFRVDEHHRPWILEINANPCLSPDAGFAAALEQAGISFDEAINRIVSRALTE